MLRDGASRRSGGLLLCFPLCGLLLGLLLRSCLFLGGLLLARLFLRRLLLRRLFLGRLAFLRLLLRRRGRSRRRHHRHHVSHHRCFSCLSCCNCYVDSTTSQISPDCRLELRICKLPLDKSIATCCLHCSHVSRFCKISPPIPALSITTVATSHTPQTGPA